MVEIKSDPQAMFLIMATGGSRKWALDPDELTYRRFAGQADWWARVVNTEGRQIWMTVRLALHLGIIRHPDARVSAEILLSSHQISEDQVNRERVAQLVRAQEELIMGAENEPSLVRDLGESFFAAPATLIRWTASAAGYVARAVVTVGGQAGLAVVESIGPLGVIVALGAVVVVVVRVRR